MCSKLVVSLNAGSFQYSSAPRQSQPGILMRQIALQTSDPSVNVRVVGADGPQVAFEVADVDRVEADLIESLATV